MKIFILLTFVLFFIGHNQPPNNKADIFEVQTGDKFYDSGGPLGNYLNCTEGDYCISNSILCGDGVVSLKFNSFSIFPANDGDRLRIYSGAEEIYSSLSGISPVGQTFTSRDTTGCLVVAFMSTSIGAAAGWDADITVTGTVTTPPETPPTPRECNLVCKNRVTVSVGTFTPFDFILNPGPCALTDYILEFMHVDGTISNTINAKDRDTEVVYKVWIKNKKNHCWGTVKVI